MSDKGTSFKNETAYFEDEREALSIREEIDGENKILVIFNDFFTIVNLKVLLNYNYGHQYDIVMLENANDFVKNLLLEGRCSYELIIVEAHISGN